MSYLLTQMFLYMLATFLLGLLLGWLIWRYGSANSGDIEAIRKERDSLKEERKALMTNLDASRSRSTADRQSVETLRGEKIDLQTKLDACEAARAGAGTAPIPTPAPVAAPVAAPVMAAPAKTSPGSKPEGLSAPRGGQADDLKRISGIGPKLELMCNGLGYYHFDQIASWTDEEVAWVDDNLEGFKGRVTRDNWISQAKDLA